MVDRIEVKIGEEFEIVEHEGKKIKLVAVEDIRDIACEICWFDKKNGRCACYECECSSRTDEKNIYFEEVKK